MREIEGWSSMVEGEARAQIARMEAVSGKEAAPPQRPPVARGAH